MISLAQLIHPLRTYPDSDKPSRKNELLFINFGNSDILYRVTEKLAKKRHLPLFYLTKYDPFAKSRRLRLRSVFLRGSFGVQVVPYTIWYLFKTFHGLK